MNAIVNDPAAPLLIALGDMDEMALLESERYSLLTLSDLIWERDLTPWKAELPARFGKTGGGPAFLDRLLNELIPEALEKWCLSPASMSIMGYSLAGLFALYAAIESDKFIGAASVSGSLWYPDILPYINSRPRFPQRVYLSYGEREAKARNRLFAPIGENTHQVAGIMRSHGAEVALEINPGGHFDQPAERMQKAARWLMEM